MDIYLIIEERSEEQVGSSDNDISILEQTYQVISKLKEKYFYYTYILD